jgi:thymidine phosphorylase
MARLQDTIVAPRSGYIQTMNARQIGRAVVDLGGGREKKGEPIDHAVGVETLCKIGDRVRAGDVLFRLHANDNDRLDMARGWIERHVFTIGEAAIEPLPLFYDAITGFPHEKP